MTIVVSLQTSIKVYFLSTIMLWLPNLSHVNPHAISEGDKIRLWVKVQQSIGAILKVTTPVKAIYASYQELTLIMVLCVVCYMRLLPGSSLGPLHQSTCEWGVAVRTVVIYQCWDIIFAFEAVDFDIWHSSKLKLSKALYLLTLSNKEEN